MKRSTSTLAGNYVNAEFNPNLEKTTYIRTNSDARPRVKNSHSKHLRESSKQTVLFLLFVLFTVLAFI